LLNKKTLTPFECKYHIVSATFLVFVDTSENLVMVDDVTTPSNFLVSLVKKEEFEEASLDVNVSQHLGEKNPSRRVVQVRVDRSAWDRQKDLKNVNAKMTMFVFIVELGFLVMAIIVGCEAQSTPFPWSIEPNT